MSLFKRVVEKKEKLDLKHLLVDADESIKVDYIKGLLFLANEDEELHEKEIEYIVNLMKKLDIDENILDDLILFVKETEDEDLLEYINKIKLFDYEVKIFFIVELFILLTVDEEKDERELDMIKDYIELLDLKNIENEIIFLSFYISAIKSEERENRRYIVFVVAPFYMAFQDFSKVIDYMLKSIGCDIQKEIEKIYKFEWDEWRFKEGNVTNDNLVSSKPVNTYQYGIFLNYLLLSKKLKQIPNINSFEYIFEDIREVLIDDIDLINFQKPTKKLLSSNFFAFVPNKDVEAVLTSKKDNIYHFCQFLKDKLNINTEILLIEYDDEIVLTKSAKGFLTDEKEQFMTRTQGEEFSWRYFEPESDQENFSLEESEDDDAFTFRVMKVDVAIDH